MFTPSPRAWIYLPHCWYLGTVLSIRLYLLRVVHPSVLSCVSVSSHTRVRPGVAVGTSAHIRYLYLPPLLVPLAPPRRRPPSTPRRMRLRHNPRDEQRSSTRRGGPGAQTEALPLRQATVRPLHLRRRIKKTDSPARSSTHPTRRSSCLGPRRPRR